MKKDRNRKSLHAPVGRIICSLCTMISLFCSNASIAQSDTTRPTKQYKNVIRYNLSGALVFGIDRYIVFGYERILTARQSFSINAGKASLPKLVTIVTDSFTLGKDLKNTGINISADYRFYLAKENKYLPPHGLYIGPFYSFNRFTRDNRWNLTNSSGNSIVSTHSILNIHTFGFELGYQFILWKRMTLDLLMVGPGLGFYTYKAEFDGNVDQAKKEQLLEGLKQLLTQKFPGMNYVFSEKQFDAQGTLNTATLGYRYIIHVGFLF